MCFAHCCFSNSFMAYILKSNSLLGFLTTLPEHEGELVHVSAPPSSCPESIPLPPSILTVAVPEPSRISEGSSVPAFCPPNSCTVHAVFNLQYKRQAIYSAGHNLQFLCSNYPFRVKYFIFHQAGSLPLYEVVMNTSCTVHLVQYFCMCLCDRCVYR